jgi:hypothetical protein
MGRSLVGVRGGVERVYPSVTVCVNVREDFQSRQIRSAPMQPQIEGWHVRLCRAAFCRQLQLNPTSEFPAPRYYIVFVLNFSPICFDEGKRFLLVLFLLLVVA